MLWRGRNYVEIKNWSCKPALGDSEKIPSRSRSRFFLCIIDLKFVMDRTDTTCVHCAYQFDLNNLNLQKRRRLGNGDKGADLVKTLSKCYGVDETMLK